MAFVLRRRTGQRQNIHVGTVGCTALDGITEEEEEEVHWTKVMHTLTTCAANLRAQGTPPSSLPIHAKSSDGPLTGHTVGVVAHRGVGCTAFDARTEEGQG